ncbi:MAG: L-rhamnose/proton symporter RhaT [Armatimonadetes bacterium]|nr:L-rhamnose/proton symporter RhaT [Armatimonadota bacterium]
MDANPFLGVVLHWIGGLAAASFYIPYKSVRRWSWETYWLVGGVFSWIFAPWVMGSLLVPGLLGVLTGAPAGSIAWAYVFGVLWGIGGLTFGLSMRYLGIALGYAIALGFCAAFGTLIPPLFQGTFGKLLSEAGGPYVLLGVLVCLGGIAVSGMAGMAKERELTAEQKTEAIGEFSFVKGLLVATFAGIMSACMAFALTAAKPITELAKEHLQASGGSAIWQGLPALIVVLAGGFTTNLLWCVSLNRRNKSGGEYLSRDAEVPLRANYLFAALAGVTWYLQFFFYTMGQTKMGAYDFSSWTLHMASIIIFSTLWGVALHEWRGTSARTHRLIALGLAVLVGSTLVIGYGNFLTAAAPK